MCRLFVFTFQPSLEVHEDILIVPGKVEPGADIIIKLEVGHTVDELGGLGGVGLNFI